MARGEQHASPAPVDDPADRLQQRFAVPVLVAALASIPAIFLTLLDEPWATVGTGINSRCASCGSNAS